ncbi:MAG: type II toxin-antitoxin system RelE/ParE family toxin [Galactobacter sp.]|uniref:type II toxin-antitoxin system RelE/ParE family toxin n=1 Tax=Galactobacter sp. TaxID=2676125 RepID=UPI0025C292BC|nr:type II toxin-antitoxin system RelE/ParE family toxin [Galactobacter sp.]
MWTVVTELVEDWLETLDSESHQQVVAALEILEEAGPQLGRPLVDTISGSKFRNMKELRPGSAGESELRILFVFDPARSAVLLVAGDKKGHWRSWYRNAILIAERRYELYLERLQRRR